MGHRNRQQSVPQPLPRANSTVGVAAFAAAKNYASAQTTGPAAGATGNVLATPLTLTPKVSGNFKVTWYACGPSSSGSNTVTLTPTVNGSPFVVGEGSVASPGGDAGHTVSSSGTMVIGAFPLGTPVAFNVAWATSAGTWGPSNGLGGVIVEEMAG